MPRQTIGPSSTTNDLRPSIKRFAQFADNRAIINHERAHIHLQHSFDMIFFDLFTCLFWFNPFSWLLRREIQSVHEYQADEQVLNNGIDAKQYQLLLIRKSVGEHKFALANNFRQRDLHKRITMMMKTKSNKRTKWNYTAALPVLFLAMVALSVPKLNAKVVEKKAEKTMEVNESFTVMGQVIDETGKPMMGVKLIKEGENEAIISDMDGNFILNTARGASVSFAMIGYKTQKVTFNKPESNFKVSLEKGEGENKKLITVRIAGRDDVNEVEVDQSKLTVSGFVKGKDGFIPGVAVVIKGSKTGTVTDPEGEFVIKAEKGDVLRFTMVGYNVFEYKVEKAERNLVIVLQPDDMAVTSGKIERVEFNKESSQQPKLVVRGTDVLKGKPLFILDGKPIENMDNVDPDNIESISVLKNASATAIYGEKGKDGVIIIVTKKMKNNGEPYKWTADEIIVNNSSKDQEIIFAADPHPSATIKPSKNNNISVQNENGTKPLIIIDGERMGKDFDINTINPKDIESISVLKDKSATDMYGKDGENGVILITKKSKKIVYEADEIELKNNTDFTLKGKKIDLSAAENRITTISAKPVEGTVEKSDKSLLLIQNKDGSQPLVVVDGKKRGALKEFNPEVVSTVRAYDGNDAVKKYGSEAKNGVVEITTKKK